MLEQLVKKTADWAVKNSESSYFSVAYVVNGDKTRVADFKG
jgi:hypothetical protein